MSEKFGFLTVFFLVLLVSFVSSVEFVPQGNINLHDTYSVINGVYLNATYIYMNGTIVSTSSASGDITAVNTNGPYLIGGAASGDVSLLLNDSYLNGTIDARDSDTTYTENSVYLTLSGTVFGFDDSVLNTTIDARDSDTTYTTVGLYVLLTGTQFSFNESRLNVTIDARDSDTTYTASTGLSLAGTIFSLAWQSLSNFTDDLGDRGYNSLSNFSNDIDLINSSYANSTYILQLNEANLNVNSSGYWDGLNSPTDITSLGTIGGATSITSSAFVGPLTGNADTATVLASNPTDCAANQFADAIAASGDLTCNAIIDADVPNTITIDLATSATNWDGETSQANLNVNSSAFWDNLNSPSDITGLGDSQITSLSWIRLNNYPSACNSNETITTLADTVLCTAISITEAQITDLVHTTQYDLNVTGDSGSGVILNNEVFDFNGAGIVTTSMSSNTLTITGSAHTVDTNETTKVNNLAGFSCSGTNKTSSFDANLNPTCTTDVDTTYTNGSAISLVGNQFNLSTCADNQIWKMNGAVWNCEADDAGAGAYEFDVTGDSGTQQTINTGDVLDIAGGTNGIDTVVGATDTVTINLDWTEVANDAISEAKIDMDTACAAGNHLYVSGNNFACEADDDTTYTNGSGISLVGTQFNHSDTSSQSSSDNSGNNFIQDVVLDTFGHITSLVVAAVNFSSYWDTSTDLDTVISADEISEVNIEFTTACASGNHYYLSGNDLACEADDDTTYTASGTLLDLTGTVFSVNEGTLTTTKWCKYISGTGIVCNVEPVVDTNETDRVNTLNATKANIGDCASGEYVQNTTVTGVECSTPPDLQGVTSVTGTSPIASSGGATPAISISLLGDLVTTSPITGGVNNIFPGSGTKATIGITVLKDLVAGDGLSGGENDVFVGGDADTTITLGTPSTLTASTSNAVTATSHTHAITTDSSGACASGVICAGDHTHPASQITAGSFGTGNYVMDTNLTVERIIFEADATNHMIYDNASCIIIKAGTTTLEVCE